MLVTWWGRREREKRDERRNQTKLSQPHSKSKSSKEQKTGHGKALKRTLAFANPSKEIFFTQNPLDNSTVARRLSEQAHQHPN